MNEDAFQRVLEAQGKTSWDRFLFWTSKFFATTDFDKNERDYKLVVTDRIIQAKDALLRGDTSWPDLMKSAIREKPNNLTSWRATQPLEAWFLEAPDTAALAFRSLWNEELPVDERFNQFVQTTESAGLKAPIAEVAFFHMAMGPTEFPMFKATSVDKAMRLTGYPTLKDVGIPAADAGRRYVYYLGFLDQMILRGARQDVVFRDRLDAQSASWSVTDWNLPKWGPVPDWTPEEQRVFEAYQGGSTFETAP